MITTPKTLFVNIPNSLSSFSDSKPHFHILNGLRGVAAIMVLCFHIFETFATSHLDQIINHGYLAVDFFFLLSGFVIGYAYDDRWKTMSLGSFIKRRLIRLQPMIVMGAIIGAGIFYLQVSNVWDVNAVSIGALLIAFLLNAFLLPSPPSTEIRGLGEMFPLNGPSWSLLFEYIANLLYALFIRRLSIIGLSILTGAAGTGLAYFAIFGPLGDICAGYALTPTEFTAGSLRVLYSFTAGLLIFRLFKPLNGIKHSFWWGSILLIALLAIPRIGDTTTLWKNGLYETFCFLTIFPSILYFAASEKLTNQTTQKICRFLGDLSYPLYMVHYPFIYWYYAWVRNNNLSFQESLPGALAVVFGSILIAYICMKLFDVPVRKWLSKRFLGDTKL